MTSIKTKIKGREWSVSVHDDFLENGNHGDCDYNDRKIRILSGQLDELDTAIHEFMHAYFEKMPHKKIKPLSQSLARLLINLGWRRS